MGRRPYRGEVLPLRFVPYHRLGDTPNVVVDGSPAPSTRLTLSHWPGAPTPPELRHDVSAGIALRAIDEPERFEGIEAVSNNHFDQDGLCAVHALVDPGHARRHGERLVDLATAGDFGVFRRREAARAAMTVAAFEGERSPWAAELASLAYPDAAALLYERLLPLVPALLDDVEPWRDLWAEEDAHLQASLDALASGEVTLEEHAALDLAVVTVPEAWAARTAHVFTEARAAALHPMAVTASTACLRVLTVYGRRYRLELRYEGWVMLVSRRPLPRPDLRVLVGELDALERAGARWVADEPGALTPQLRTVGDAESSMAPEELLVVIERFLAGAAPAWDPFAPR